MDAKTLQRTIYTYYDTFGKKYPWRETTKPYDILVSELMLQQTQTDRVVPKYIAFLKQFPTAEALAKASVADVLKAWQGLGYNRRALFLKKCAEHVVTNLNGDFPKTSEELQELPGIGPYTAAAIMAFAYNKPSTVVETNIRTVYIHFFFKERKTVTDKELIPLIISTMDAKNPRKWFNALMDYGAMLKKTIGNSSRKSKTYTKQSKFEGSERQIRGKVLRFLLSETKTEAEIIAYLADERSKKVLSDLEKEGFIEKKGTRIHLKE